MTVLRRGGAATAAWALALLAGAAPARAGSVGVEVLDALQAAARVRVFILLREPEAPATDLSLRAGEVSDIRHGVLSQLDPEEFHLTHQFLTISAVAGDVTLAGLRKLAADPDVVKVDLDVPVRAALAESVPLIHADAVHNAGVTGRGVTVAVLDTGVDPNHPDFKDRLVAEQCFCANPDGSGCCPNGSVQQGGSGAARDENGHGTNVAGIIASGGRSAPPGVAPEAGLVAVRVLDKAGSAASTAQIMQGLDWVTANHPEVKVINLSLATANLFSGNCDNAASFTQGFAQSIGALRSRGVLTVVSSGNNANASQIAAPACVASAIAVGAVYDGNVGSVSFGCTDSTTGTDRVACFSNASTAVDLLAPGGAITSSGIGGGTSTFFGTSQAAPHAAGAAALLLSAKPGLTPDQIENALKGTGAAITDSRNGMGFKRIDVQAALAATP